MPPNHTYWMWSFVLEMPLMKENKEQPPPPPPKKKTKPNTTTTTNHNNSKISLGREDLGLSLQLDAAPRQPHLLHWKHPIQLCISIVVNRNYHQLILSLQAAGGGQDPVSWKLILCRTSSNPLLIHVVVSGIFLFPKLGCVPSDALIPCRMMASFLDFRVFSFSVYSMRRCSFCASLVAVFSF